MSDLLKADYGRRIPVKPQPERIAKGLWWDRAWSLIGGCSPVSEGCQNCWSAREAHMRSKQKNEKIREQYAGLTYENGKWNGKIRLLEKNLDLPLRVKKPQVWAVWNDLFREDVPFEFILKAFLTAWYSPSHIFLILTKRPDRMKQYFDWEKEYMQGYFRSAFVDRGWKWQQNGLPNVFLGVTAENQQAADERIPVLLQIPAAARFMSVEPMLSAIYFTKAAIIECPVCNDGKRWTNNPQPSLCYKCGSKQIISSKLDLVICGGETGPGARPMHPAWVRSLRDQCVAAGVKFWFKQWGEYCAISQMPPETYRAWDIHHGTENCWDENDPRWHVGKKAAGRLLDGQEWSQFPEV